MTAEPPKPDLNALPEPVRLLLAAALEARASAALAAESETRAQRSASWKALFAVANADIGSELGCALLPFACLPVLPPDDWTGEEQRYAVPIVFAGWPVISAHYESSVNPPGWLRVPGFFAAAGTHLNLADALVAAWDAACDPEPDF